MNTLPLAVPTHRQIRQSGFTGAIDNQSWMNDQASDESSFECDVREVVHCPTKALAKWVQGTWGGMRPAFATAGSALIVTSLIKAHHVLNSNPNTTGFNFLSQGAWTQPIVDLSQVWSRTPIADWDHEATEFIEWTPQSLQTDDAIRAFYEAEDADS